MHFKSLKETFDLDGTHIKLQCLFSLSEDILMLILNLEGGTEGGTQEISCSMENKFLGLVFLFHKLVTWPALHTLPNRPWV